MGGNALKEYGVRRVDAATYDRIKADALNKLAVACTRMAVPYEMRDKEDYGDVDILCIIKPEYQANWRAWLQATFNPRAILNNGNVWSVNIEDLQVDLITTSLENWGQYFCFLCWGDLSMTMGRISRLYDLKYGIYGLEMPIRDSETNHVTDTVTISKDPSKIFPFLGYDFKRWEQGFKTQVELREFLFSSNRIHKGFLTSCSEASRHRKRDRNRAMFSSWLAWFEEHREEFPEEANLPIPKSIDEKIAYIEAAFPESNLRVQYDAAQKRISDFTTARSKFSGKHIQDMFPELQGRAFGALMDLWTRQWATKEEQVQYILHHNVEHLTNLAQEVRSRLVLT